MDFLVFEFLLLLQESTCFF